MASKYWLLGDTGRSGALAQSLGRAVGSLAEDRRTARPREDAEQSSDPSPPRAGTRHKTMAPAKKGGRAKGEARTPRSYPAYDVKASKGPAHKQNPQKLRESLKPGAVLILLAGRFRGKRVVLLKALESGLLLVTGPFAVNGVPIKRVNAAYVIATSTTVDLSSVPIPAKLNDAYFAREKANIGEKDDNFFSADKPAPPVETSDERKKDQKAIDDKLLKVIEKTPMLKAYLGALFTLTKGMKPHEMKF